MNICKQFKCETCETLIDCRVGMSNRDIQPFQFACPNCEEIISFVVGVPDGELVGAIDVGDFEGPFKGENPFVDLHLDFPAKFGKYEMGNTAYMRAVAELDPPALADLGRRLHLLNILYPKLRDLQRLITQYKRGDLKSFKRICSAIPEIELKSDKKQDVLAALYSATSIMSSPLTIHEHNKELSNEMPRILQGLYSSCEGKTIEFFEAVFADDFVKNLHHDCLSLYPKILSLDLPLRPAIYYDYLDTDDMGSVPTRVSTSDFGACSDVYKDLAEVYSRQLVIVAGLNNLIKRNDYDLFDIGVRTNTRGELIREYSSLDKYANVDLGKKVDAIDDSFYRIDVSALDNRLRNGIAHYKYEYKESSQLITYYPKKEGMKREVYHSLYFIEFMRKILLLFREVHSMNHVIKSLLFFRIFVLHEQV